MGVGSIRYDKRVYKVIMKNISAFSSNLMKLGYMKSQKPTVDERS